MFKQNIYYDPLPNDTGNNDISIDNCTYYFMLYIDNELNAIQKKAVDDFIANNEQAKMLFNDFKATVLITETVKFNKDNLYKTNTISVNNYEQKIIEQLNEQDKFIDNLDAFIKDNPTFEINAKALLQTKLIAENISINKTLLYKPEHKDIAHIPTIAQALLLQLDNETSQTESTTIQQLINTNAIINTEWQYLQQVQLPIENILHPNKKSLYKHKKYKTPIVPLWLRYTAAACFIIGLLYTSKQLIFTKNKQSEQYIVTTKKTNLPITNKTENVIQKNNTTIVSTNSAINKIQTNVFANNTYFNNIVVKKELTAKTAVTKITDNRKTIIKVENENEINNNAFYGNNEITAQSLLSNEKSDVALKNNLQNKIIETTNVDNKLIINYYETEQKSDVSILNIDATKIDKNNKSGKLKNRIQSFINNKKESLSNGITIAGYEIAIAKPR